MFFLFNVTKIKYNLTKKNVYDIFSNLTVKTSNSNSIKSLRFLKVAQFFLLFILFPLKQGSFYNSVGKTPCQKVNGWYDYNISILL